MDVSKRLERVEFFVANEITPTQYACKVCEDGVLAAPGPARPIAKGILAYFKDRLTNGLVEGLDNHLRMIARRAKESRKLASRSDMATELAPRSSRARTRVTQRFSPWPLSLSPRLG